MAGFFERIFNPGSAYGDASDEMKKYYQQAMQGEQQAQQGFQPYMQRGNEAGNSLMDFLKQLSDSQGLENKWTSGYNTSPYAQQMLSKNQSSGMDAASQMGLMGSSTALQNIQNNAGNIVQGDRQQYMNDLMQKFMSGIGLGTDVYNQGANAAGQNANMATNMGNQAINMGDTAGGMKYNQEMAGPQMFEKILGMLGGAAGQYATGGFGKGDYGRGAWSPETGNNDKMMETLKALLPYLAGGI